jgi:hypothetical protein
MRNLSSLIARRKSPAKQPTESTRRGTDKDSSESKPAPKRCLNEAAHKLGR